MSHSRLGFIAVCCVLLTTASAKADAVTDWNEIMQTTAAVSPNPALRARTAVITQVAVFEAVNSIVGEYRPYSAALPALPGALAEAAAVAAAHRALIALHPDVASDLNTARDASLAVLADGPGKDAGIAVGIAAADAILELRAHDGFGTEVPYTPGTAPGRWQPTPPDFTPAILVELGRTATFGLRSNRQFRASPPPALRSRAYARDFEEVKTVGEKASDQRPRDRADIARFYELTDADGIYHPAARQISEAQRKTLSENARIFALLSMAIWDGAVACFDTKYHYNFWRPVTAIRAAGTDGNRWTEPDPQWETFAFTPPFPSYPSGHATIGGAARAVLEHAYGEAGHAITLTNAQVPDIVLRYTSFKQITDDIDDGRVYGGVHFRFDQEAGARQGRLVGRYVFRNELCSMRDRSCGRLSQRAHRRRPTSKRAAKAIRRPGSRLGRV
jgi:hypothetical protein